MYVPEHENIPEKEISTRLKELARLFLRLGATAFGGPAAQIAIMHDETVRRKKWLDDKSFLDLIGAVNLIPGPNSTEVAIHIGYLRAGWRGLVTAGACFIIPAAVIVTALTWVYVQYGSTPEGNHFFYGIKPVIIAVILQAIVFIGRKAVTEPVAIATGIAAAVAYMFGVNEIALLFLGGLFVMLWKNIGSMRGGSAAAFLVPFLGLDGAAAEAKGASLMSIFLVFLKIGSVLYGSGYVLLAFLNSDFVEHRGWLTHQQLLDVVAIGQVTPGPWFTTATAIGYLLGGVPGAALATLGIFLPSFIFVALTVGGGRARRSERGVARTNGGRDGGSREGFFPRPADSADRTGRGGGAVPAPRESDVAHAGGRGRGAAHGVFVRRISRSDRRIF